jgi:hypothetical protein
VQKYEWNKKIVAVEYELGEGRNSMCFIISLFSALRHSHTHCGHPIDMAGS